MNNTPTLSENSTIGAWMQHPRGADIITTFGERAGMGTDALKMLRNLPLLRLLEGTGMPDPSDIADNLVAQLGEQPGGEVEEGWHETVVPERFAGKTVIVTGAASGIGRAVASRIGREGGTVVAVDISEAALATLVDSLPDARIRPVTANITDETAVDRIMAAAGQRVDGLANVAGLSDDFSAIHDVSDDMLQRVFDVNVFGLIRLTRRVVPVMLAANRGSIVNIASEAALRGSSSGLAYTASKHAVIGVTRSMAYMYQPYGIRVNTVAPGGTLTGMRPSTTAGLGPERIRSFGAPVPIALPENLAAPIAFLLSDDSANINGALLPSDGGESVF